MAALFIALAEIASISFVDSFISYSRENSGSKTVAAEPATIVIKGNSMAPLIYSAKIFAPKYRLIKNLSADMSIAPITLTKSIGIEKAKTSFRPYLLAAAFIPQYGLNITNNARQRERNDTAHHNCMACSIV